MPKVGLVRLFLDFFFIGLTTLGGGYAIVPQVLRLVEKNRWMTHEEFQQLFSMSQLAPGPVGINLPILVGRKLRGIAGAIVGFLAITFAPLAVIFVLVSWLDTLMDWEVVRQIMVAVRIAVAGVILSAGMEMFAKNQVRVWEIVVFSVMLGLLIFTGLNAVFTIILGFSLGLFFLAVLAKRE